MSNCYEGGCLCKEIRYRATSAPTRCVICHCEQCRKHSGAPCLGFVHFSIESFTWLKSEPKRFRSSKYAERGFCPTCGSTVSMHEEILLDRIQIALGSLDEPSRVKPQDHVWTQSAIDWLRIADELPRFTRSSDAIASKAEEV